MKRRQREAHFPREDRHLTGRIREVRVSFEGGAFRVLYATVGAHDQVLLGLHAFTKKTQKTPPAAIDKALRRLQDWEARGT